MIMMIWMMMGLNMIKGIVIEEPAFLGNESGRKNLELLYMLRHKRDKKRIADVMQMLGSGDIGLIMARRLTLEGALP